MAKPMALNIVSEFNYVRLSESDLGFYEYCRLGVRSMVDSHSRTASEASSVRFTKECSPPSIISVLQFGLLIAAAARSCAMFRSLLWVSRDPFKVSIGI